MSIQARYRRKSKPPKGWDYIEPTMTALDEEMRNAIADPHEGKRKVEALWPVYQINNQRSRYIFDMYYKYKRISRQLYDYCLREKLADANLIAKWKKLGYERLCCTHAINPRNFNYGTTSICRVPRDNLEPGRVVIDQTCGCRGCASGAGGYKNIFGNKYGQKLAAIQIKREKREQEQREQEQQEAEAAEKRRLEEGQSDQEETRRPGARKTREALYQKGETSKVWAQGDEDLTDDDEAGVDTPPPLGAAGTDEQPGQVDTAALVTSAAHISKRARTET